MTRVRTLGQSAPGVSAVRRPRVGISPVTISHRMTPKEYISTCTDAFYPVADPGAFCTMKY